VTCDYVRGYQDNSGGSHMFALWTRVSEPDEDDVDGWVWIVASKVTHVTHGFHPSGWGAGTTVVHVGGAEILTRAHAEEVRWGIDLALNGGVHRTKPMLNLESKATREAYEDAQLAGFIAAQAALTRNRGDQ
jgi:hypothetical protein